VRALSIVGERQVEVRTKPDPSPGPGEVVIGLRTSGICGSDLHLYRRPGPAMLENDVTPGHEPSGVIVAVGHDVSGWSVGDRVVSLFRRSCGTCADCRLGWQHLCRNLRPGYGFAANGSNAEFMASDASCLIRLPDELEFRDGTVLVCQGGTAYAPLRRLDVGPGDVVYVAGLGPVGLLTTMFASAMGARVIGIDPSADRRDLGQRLGCEVALDPTIGELPRQMGDLGLPEADKLVDTSGSPASYRTIGQIVHGRGRVALVGIGAADFAVPLADMQRREIEVFGSTIYPIGMFGELCRFVADHRIELDAVVGPEYTLDQGPQAFQLADSATTGKVCFRIA
jgi:threonine dehydrogenase-like Zn-dependent dehydrogenase